MRCIPLSDAQPGLVLDADAVNAQQMLLLKKGTVLTEKALRMLKSWGVETIRVAEPDAATAVPPPCVSADCRDLEQALTTRFGDTLENPIMAAICGAAIRIVSERG